MSKQKEYTRIEEAIMDLLDGELQENALKFANYLSENDLIPNMAAEGKIPFNGYNLGWMRIDRKNDWMFEIFNFLDFAEFDDDDEAFKKAVYERVAICESPCHDQCWRAKDVKIFGKEFKSVCSQHSRAFVNPDGEMIEHIKKLIEYSKKTTPYPQQYHPNHS